MFSTVQPGEHYSVQVIGAGFTGQVHRFQAPADGSHFELQVRETSPAPTGKVTVKLQRRGFNIGNSRYHDDLGLWIADLDSGWPLVSRGKYDKGPSTFSLPPGRYRAVLEGRPFVDSHHGTLMTPRQAGRAEQIIEVHPGSEQTITLNMNSGGRLEIKLTGTATPEDKAAIKKRYNITDSNPPWLEEESRKAKITLSAPNFLSEPVLYSAEDGHDTSSFGIHLQRGWPLGKTHRSEVLPTGTYQLTATMPAGRSISTQVTIEENEVHQVTLAIAPQK